MTLFTVIAKDMHIHLKTALASWILPLIIITLLYAQIQAHVPVSKPSPGAAATAQAGGTLDFTLLRRDTSSFWLTKTMGLPLAHVTHLVPFC